MSKSISMTNGGYALVDDEDYDLVAAHSWQVMKTGNTRLAVRSTSKNGEIYSVLMHREIMNPEPGSMVIHLNGDGMDNRRENLKECTRGQKNEHSNKYATYKGVQCKSRFRGVSWHNQANKWQAQISIDGKLKNLGLYISEIDAARAYDKVAKNTRGEMAKLNFP